MALRIFWMTIVLICLQTYALEYKNDLTLIIPEHQMIAVTEAEKLNFQVSLEITRLDEIDQIITHIVKRAEKLADIPALKTSDAAKTNPCQKSIEQVIAKALSIQNMAKMYPSYRAKGVTRPDIKQQRMSLVADHTHLIETLENMDKNMEYYQEAADTLVTMDLDIDDSQLEEGLMSSTYKHWSDRKKDAHAATKVKELYEVPNEDTIKANPKPVEICRLIQLINLELSDVHKEFWVSTAMFHELANRQIPSTVLIDLCTTDLLFNRQIDHASVKAVALHEKGVFADILMMPMGKHFTVSKLMSIPFYYEDKMVAVSTKHDRPVSMGDSGFIPRIAETDHCEVQLRGVLCSQDLEFKTDQCYKAVIASNVDEIISHCDIKLRETSTTPFIRELDDKTVVAKQNKESVSMILGLETIFQDPVSIEHSQRLGLSWEQQTRFIDPTIIQETGIVHALNITEDGRRKLYQAGLEHDNNPLIPHKARSQILVGLLAMAAYVLVGSLLAFTLWLISICMGQKTSWKDLKCWKRQPPSNGDTTSSAPELPLKGLELGGWTRDQLPNNIYYRHVENPIIKKEPGCPCPGARAKPTERKVTFAPSTKFMSIQLDKVTTCELCFQEGHPTVSCPWFESPLRKIARTICQHCRWNRRHSMSFCPIKRLEKAISRHDWMLNVCLQFADAPTWAREEDQNCKLCPETFHDSPNCGWFPPGHREPLEQMCYKCNWQKNHDPRYCPMYKLGNQAVIDQQLLAHLQRVINNCLGEVDIVPLNLGITINNTNTEPNHPTKRFVRPIRPKVKAKKRPNKRHRKPDLADNNVTFLAALNLKHLMIMVIEELQKAPFGFSAEEKYDLFTMREDLAAMGRDIHVIADRMSSFNSDTSKTIAELKDKEDLMGKIVVDIRDTLNKHDQDMKGATTIIRAPIGFDDPTSDDLVVEVQECADTIWFDNREKEKPKVHKFPKKNTGAKRKVKQKQNNEQRTSGKEVVPVVHPVTTMRVAIDDNRIFTTDYSGKIGVDARPLFAAAAEKKPDHTWESLNTISSRPIREASLVSWRAKTRAIAELMEIPVEEEVLFDNRMTLSAAVQKILRDKALKDLTVEIDDDIETFTKVGITKEVIEDWKKKMLSRVTSDIF